MSAAECHPERPNRGRGLCAMCYTRARRSGTRHLYPTRASLGRPPRCLVIAEDFAWVLECGCQCHQDGPLAVHGRGYGCPCGGTRALADRLGMTRDALAKALQRARRRGVMVA